MRAWPDQVVAGQCQWQRQFLDGEGVGLTVGGQCRDDVVVHAELGEGGSGVLLVDDGGLH